MSRIFISYRRSDAAAEAGRIYDYLEGHFGPESIFKDSLKIDAGDDFRERLNDAVGHCQVLLAVMGNSWLEVTDELGKRRLANPADWVRLELETALRRNVHIIPILLDDVVMPAVHDLPRVLRPLAYRNAARVRHDPDFRHDMDRLLVVIQRHLEEGALPLSEPSPDFRRDMDWILDMIQRYFQGSSNDWANPINRRRLVQMWQYYLVNRIDRRRFLRILLNSCGGLAAVLFAKSLFKSGGASSQRSSSPALAPSASITPSTTQLSTQLADWPLPSLEPEVINGITAEFNVATVNVLEQSISIVRKHAEFFTEDLGSGITLDLMGIPGGIFVMGSPASEVDRQEDEGPQGNVSVPSFWMGKYLVTQAQWRAVAALPKIEQDLNPSPAFFVGDNRPVEMVSWYEAIEFCQRLSAKSGHAYRLPSEAEWEYACRARTTTPFHVGETLTEKLVNCRATEAYNGGPQGGSRGETTEVGIFPANAFGLYDMHGNVWEWCQDNWHESYENAPVDGSAWLASIEDDHIRRGGSWDDYPRNCRSAFRGDVPPDFADTYLGFRVSCLASSPLE